MIKEIGKGVWAFCAYLFVPKWGRSKSGNTEERIIKRDTFMNRRNVGIANHESLLEGCYHEMGHVLARVIPQKGLGAYDKPSVKESCTAQWPLARPSG